MLNRVGYHHRCAASLTKNSDATWLDSIATSQSKKWLKKSKLVVYTELWFT